MDNDLLAQYRRTPPSRAAGLGVPQGSEEYSAFGTKDKVQRLRIRSTTAPVHSPGYNILLDVVYDGDHGTNFVLVYTVLMVLVRGKNLQKAVFAIENGMADFIQQFDPERWAEPADSNAAFIESIEVKVVDGNAPRNDEHH